LVPSFGSRDDGLGIGFPDERPGVAVVRRDEAVDGFLQGDDGGEYAAFALAFGELGEQVSTAFCQEHEVGVKWKIQCGYRVSQAAPWRAGARRSC
jgi:hypothetical protein